jgi:hypothetical protein
MHFLERPPLQRVLPPLRSTSGHHRRHQRILPTDLSHETKSNIFGGSAALSVHIPYISSFGFLQESSQKNGNNFFGLPKIL